MADEAMVSTVKLALGVTGDFLDATIGVYVDEVVDYMLTAGVSSDLISSSAGTVARGVADLWNNSSGGGKLSPYFYDRVSQLVCKTQASTNGATGG